ncbi:MAG: hypothetical protein IPK64_19890 [bacterium]|nr:hypothetical protein [bacterium]
MRDRIDPLSQDWQLVAEHLQQRLEKDRKALETAQDKSVITLQARIALLRELLDLPRMSRPAPTAPLGFESNYHG